MLRIVWQVWKLTWTLVGFVSAGMQTDSLWTTEWKETKDRKWLNPFLPEFISNYIFKKKRFFCVFSVQGDANLSEILD